MKKLLFVVLVGVFCFSVTSLFAQNMPSTKTGTLQDKLLLLEAENAQLRAQVVSLNSQVQGNVSQSDSPNALKPYYADLEIQQLCEEFDAIEGLGSDRDFKIDTYMKERNMKWGKTVAKANLSVSHDTSSVFTGYRPRTVYTITLTILSESGKTARIKTYTKWIYNNNRGRKW